MQWMVVTGCICRKDYMHTVPGHVTQHHFVCIVQIHDKRVRGLQKNQSWAEFSGNYRFHSRIWVF